MSVARLVKQEGGGADDGDAHDRGIVEGPRGIDGIGADAGPGEDRLRQHRAGDEIGEGEADHRQGRDQRIAQRMIEQHAQLPRSLGPSHQHVILAQHIQHAGPHQPGDDPHDRPAQHEGRQRQMPERIGEARIIAGQQRVDGEEASHDRRRHGVGIEPPRPGQPMDLDREDEQQDQPRPEDRDRGAQQCEEPGGVIGQPVAPGSGQHAQAHAHQRAQDHRGHHQLERGRQPLGDIGQHRTLGAEGDPEVAVNEIADIDQILLGQAAVEAPALLGGGDDIGILRRAIADDARQRIGMGGMGDDEGDGDDAEKKERHRDQSSDDVAVHGRCYLD